MNFGFAVQLDILVSLLELREIWLMGHCDLQLLSNVEWSQNEGSA